MAGPWLRVDPESPFGLTNLPYGVAAPAGQDPRPVVAVGTQALDLAALARAGGLDGTLPDPAGIFTADRLDPFLAAGRPTWAAVRSRLQELLTDPAARSRVEPALLPRSALRHVLPFA